jgi:hypothetical protein
MAANVPNTVATTADRIATLSVTQSALISVASPKRASYQRKEKPFHCPIVLESLKENTISTAMGAYKNRSINAR